MKKRFKQVRVGQEFTHPVTGRKLTKIEDTIEGFDIGNARDAEGGISYIEDQEEVEVTNERK